MPVNAFKKCFPRIKYELSTGAQPHPRKNLKFRYNKKLIVTRKILRYDLLIYLNLYKRTLILYIRFAICE